MRVLVTGVSGTGKSSLVAELRRRGHQAFDADDDGCSTPRPDGTWGWEVDRVRALLDSYGEEQLVFFSGCSDEQAAVRFDFKILLTAPVEVILDRLRLRTTNPFGKTRAERERVVADIEWVLPLLEAAADLVVDTTQSLDQVADVVLAAVTDARA